MKTIVSLLSLLQLLALCQFGFGVFGAGFNYFDHASDIAPQIRDEQVAQNVLRWHENTVETAKAWSIGAGLLTFCLATCVLVAVARLPAARERHEEESA